MDSVLSSNQNEQIVAKNGQGAPETEDNEIDVDFDENHQRLLFGGSSASTPEASSESTIAAVSKPGQPVQRARESTDDLNLVAISALPANGVKGDAKPNTPTTTYEPSVSNPLPVLAKTGVASTVSLQTPNSDNAIPAGRRSGASDKIAVQLAADATPKPMITQEVRLDQLDSETKHRIVTASVNSLYERLGQPVPTGAANDNAQPIVSLATTRRSAGTGDVQVFSSTPAANVPATNRAESRPVAEPLTGTRNSAELMLPGKPAADVKQEVVNPPVTRGSGDLRVVNGTILPAQLAETFNTTGGAKTRVEAPTDVTTPGARVRTPAEPTIDANANVPVKRTTESVGPETMSLPRANGKSTTDGPLTGTLSVETPTNGTRPRSSSELTITPDNGTTLPRVTGKQVFENTGTQLPPGTIAGDMLGINRAPSANRAFIPEQPLANPKFPVPTEQPIKRAGSLDTYPSVPTPAAPELVVLRTPRAPGDPAEVPGSTGTRMGDVIRTVTNGPVIPSPTVPADRHNGDKTLPVIKPAGSLQEIAPAQTTTIGGKEITTAGIPTNPLKDVRQNAIDLLQTSTEQVASIATTVNRNGAKVSDVPSLPTRPDGLPPTQPVGRIEVIGGTVTITTPKPGTDVTAVSPSPAPAVIRNDGTIKVADVPKGGTTTDTGSSIGSTAAKSVSNNGDPIQQPRVTDGILPRTDNQATGIRNDGQTVLPLSHGNRHGEVLPPTKTPDGLPVDKTGRPIEAGNVTDRNGVKIADTSVPGNSAIPGSIIAGADKGLPRATEPTVAGDKTVPKTVDGRPVETGRNGEVLPRGGETLPRGSETIPRNGETLPRSGESARTADGGTRVTGDSVPRKDDASLKGAETAIKGSETVARASETGVKVSDSVGRVVEPAAKISESASKAIDAPVKVADNAKVSDKVEVAAKSADAQGKTAGEVATVGKSVELAGKIVNEVALGQKIQDVNAKGISDVSLKSNDAVRGTDTNIKAQDLIANNAQVGDRNVRLSDAIVRAAELAIIKGSEHNQQVKLDGSVRVSDQSIQSNQVANQMNALGNQMNANAQQGKIDAVRNDANAIVRGDQNQIAQNQLGIHNQIAQHNVIGRNSDQIAAPAAKQSPDCPVPGQRNVDVKIDQVVADILNHVRNNKDQHGGAKIISSLDQANNAANQQHDPKALLDAAAVRRILDGQGITLSPSALNTLMEGIKPTGEQAIDYALPSIGSLNLSQIISLGERLQEAVSGAGNETSEPQPKTQLQQHRTKYLVKEGDTLESIAQEKLGDARLVQLLITINRALVNYRLEGEKKVAYVVPNQYMWLPTDHELEVHKRNFFGKQGKDGSVALAINSKQNTPIIPPVSFDHTKEVSAEVSQSMQDFRPASSASNPLSGNRMSAGYEVKKMVPQAGSISSSNSGSIGDSGSISGSGKMAGNLDRLRHAGDRRSIKLDEIEYASTQVSHRQCYQVREGESLMSIAASLESMGHISMWKLLAKINGFQIEEGGLGKPVENLHAGQFIVLPTTEELSEYKLLEKLTTTSKSASSNASVAENAFSCVQHQKQIATPPPPALVALAQGVGGLTTVQKLSSYTRLVLNDLPQLENCFSITVEARWNGQWKPMAAYECRHGQTIRHLYNKNGEIKSMELDLPPYVVKEMAREDFVRNWNAYVNIFMGNAASV